MSKARDLGNLLDTDGDVVSSSLDNVPTPSKTSIEALGIALPAANLTGTVADARVSTLTASKLTGALPAISGANLTGIVAGPTISANDPAINTNPSGGVGTQWANSTSGEMFVCTDATAGENIWTNVGAGSGNVRPWSYPGSTYGYAIEGGARDKYSFASSSSGVSTGSLSVSRDPFAGQSSADHGYCSGGVGSYHDVIDKFPFATDANSTDVGNLFHGRNQAGDSSSSTHGYTHGGKDGTTGGDTVDKFTFASNANATDVGNLQQNRYGVHGNSSETYAYAAGGTWTGHSNNLHIIEKVPFASDGNTTDVGNMSTSRGDRTSGNSSATYGYHAAGHAGWGYTNVIDKHSFASDAGATDVGNCTQSKLGMAGSGDTTHAYWAGGSTGGNINVIERNTYSSDGNATDVGNLSTTYGTHVAGVHV